MAFDLEHYDESPVFQVATTFKEIQTEIRSISSQELVDRVWNAINNCRSHGIYYGTCGYYFRKGFISEKQRAVLEEFLIRWIMFN